MEFLLGHQFLGNDVLRWIIAGSVTLLTLAVLAGARRLVVVRLVKLSARSKTRFDDILVDVLKSTKGLALAAGAVAAGARTLELPPDGRLWVGRAVILVLAVQGGLWATTAVKLWVDARQGEERGSAGARTFAAAAAFITNLVVWGVIVLVVLSNFGVEITALVAGLGIGGIAAALAVQNLLSDLFAAFSIYTDRPFDIGDFIAVDTYLGTVERIGWRTTQLRSLGGETIVMANGDLARSRLRNYARMTERRVVVSFGVEYGVPAAKLAWITAFLREIIEQTEGLRFDRSHFKGYGESSLDFETVFYVLSPDYGVFMDKQQGILMALYERFEKEGIGFAFPTRTVHVRSHGERAA